MFLTKDDLIEWARAIGKNAGFVVVIYRSDMGAAGANQKTFVTLG